MAIIFLTAAGADGDIVDDELAEIATYFTTVVESLCVTTRVDKLLRRAAAKVGDEELLEESIALLGEHLSTTMLASIVNSITEIAGTDELQDSEDEFVAARTVGTTGIEKLTHGDSKVIAISAITISARAIFHSNIHDAKRGHGHAEQEGFDDKTDGHRQPKIPQRHFCNFNHPQGMVMGSCDRALGRKARGEGLRTRPVVVARDFAPKPQHMTPSPCRARYRQSVKPYHPR